MLEQAQFVETERAPLCPELGRNGRGGGEECACKAGGGCLGIETIGWLLYQMSKLMGQGKSLPVTGQVALDDDHRSRCTHAASVSSASMSPGISQKSGHQPVR